MNRDKSPSLVSIHGGHSGEFCNHANDTLEDIVNTYIERGFAWIGITEHMPPLSSSHLYPDEIEAGLSIEAMYQRFSNYMTMCHRLKKKYSSSIEIFVGFETEYYTDYLDFVQILIREFQPDYIVGSIHHVNDILINSTFELYTEAIKTVGGLDELYCIYFDQQFDLINTLQPEVIGHFDLIRFYDSDYPTRLKKPEIQMRIRRNLERIKELGLILDVNTAALRNGATEPFVSKPILIEAYQMGIAVVPGDDSHGLNSVGLDIEKAIKILQEIGFETNWPKPIWKKVKTK